jgi:hypothetical protein
MKMKKRFCVMVVVVFGIIFTFISCVSSSGVSSKESESYFVNIDGNDDNNGLSEATAFKTLGKAIQAATSGTIKRIAIVGTINGTININNSGAEEILITGVQNAILTCDGSNVLTIRGNSKIRLENIVITGGNERGGIIIDNNSTLILGTGSKVYGNTSDNAAYGGGVTVYNSNATLIIEADAEIRDNRAEIRGGGITSAGTVIVKDNAKISGNFAGTYGGGIFFLYGTVTVQDNAIVSGNSTQGDGGGIFGFNRSDVGGGDFILKGNAVISNNSAVNGGGFSTNDPHNISFTKEGGIVYGSDALSDLANKASSNGAVAFLSGGGQLSGKSRNNTIDNTITFARWNWNWLEN